MPVPHMPKVNDIFWSAQGEGLNSGMASIFIRLAGCSLRCPYCDSRGAWRSGREMDSAGIAAVVDALQASTPGARLVVTGGEPLEQDLEGLMRVLRRRRYFVAVETNGLHFQDLPFDWWTVSPKDVAGYRVHARLWARADEIKLLVTAALNPDVLTAIRKKTRAPIILQPEHGRPGKYRHAFDFYKDCQQRGIADVRLGAQLHKIYRVP
jgi:7-carboxy-7-deazaguanine synthase